MPTDDTALLRKAVTSLEKKYREAQEASAAREAEAQRANAAAEQAAAAAAQQCAASHAEVVAAVQQRDAAQAAAREAQAVATQQTAQAGRCRAECEDWQAGEARALGCKALAEEQVRQLEAANRALREDNLKHAARLKEAYQRYASTADPTPSPMLISARLAPLCREGELLAQAAELQAQMRRLAPPAAARPALCQPGGTGPSAGAETALEQGLLLATAQQMAANFAARADQVGCAMEACHCHLAGPCRAAPVACNPSACMRRTQAERQARQLEQQLAKEAEQAQQLQRQQEERQQQQAAEVAELRGELQAARAQCAQEQQAARELLESNMRLHETVVTLVQQAAGATLAPQARSAAARAGPSARQTCGSHLAAARSLPPRRQAAPAPKDQQALAAATHSARQKAAVRAALALAAEHRGLLERCQAAAAALRHHAAEVLPSAGAGAQLHLLRQQGQMQRELQGLSARLDDKAVQLMALRQSGML